MCGNYWCSYDGEDNDGDGLGDSAYDKDALPLIVTSPSVDTSMHESNPPEEIISEPYEKEVEEQEMNLPGSEIVEIKGNTQSMSSEEESLAEELTEAKEVGDTVKIKQIENSLAQLRGQTLEYVQASEEGNEIAEYSGEITDEIKWSTGDILVAGMNASEVNPSIAADSDGNLYMVVEHAGTTDTYLRIYKSSDNGNTWYHWTLLFGAPDNTDPSLAVGEGTENWLLLAFTDGDTQIKVFRWNLDSPGVEGATIETNSLGVSHPVIVTDSSEFSGWYAYLIYNSKAVDNWALRFSKSTDFGVNWSTPTSIAGYCGYPDEYYNALNGRPGIDYGSGRLYVAFDNYYPCGTTQKDVFVTVSSNYGSSWGTPTRITTTSYNEYDPSVAAVKKFSTNRTAVVGYERDSSSGDVYFGYTRDGGSNWFTNYCIACTSHVESNCKLATSNDKGAIHGSHFHNSNLDYKSTDYLNPAGLWSLYGTGIQGISNTKTASQVYHHTLTTNPQMPVKDEAAIGWPDMRNYGSTGYDVYFDAPQLPGEGGCYDYNLSTWITPPESGSWYITHHIECNHTDIKLNGNLNIYSTGRLTLNDVTLYMNCSYNGQYGINVYDGGGLHINDIGVWDSVITNGDVSNAYYTFRVYKGSDFKLIGSQVRNAGYAWNLDTAGNNYNNAGLWINTDNTVIDRSYIYNNHFMGIIYYNSSNNVVTNSYIYFNDWDGIYTSSSGNNYFQNNYIFANGDDGLVLSSKNKIIDCSINNNGDDGIVLTSADNTEITGCHISSNGDAGVTASNSDYLYIGNNNFFGNNEQEEGIRLSSCDHCTIKYNNLDRHRWFGIHLSNSMDNSMNNNNVTNTTAEAGSAGIYLFGSPENNINKNNASMNLDGILLWESPNSSVYGNIAKSNGGTGISLQKSSNSKVVSNKANQNGVGIGLSSTTNTHVVDNTVLENRRGISLGHSSTNVVRNNFVNDNDFGISLMWSSNNNFVNDNDFGISLMWSSNNNFVNDNDARANNNYGLYMFKCSNNVITFNELNKTGSIGTYLEDSHGNFLVNNNALYCGNYGMDLFNSDRNTIHENDVSGSTNIGIGLSSSDQTDIRNNTATNSNIGISMRWSSGNYIVDNNASLNDMGVYMLQSHRNMISRNHINNNNNNGIELSIANNNNIIDNWVNNNPNYGIHVYSSTDNTIESNMVHRDGIGIYLDWSESNEIFANSVNHSKINGITLDWYSNGNWVADNTVFHSNNISIQVSNSNDNVLERNTARDSAVGIFLDWSKNNTVMKNDVSRNVYNGINLEWFSNENRIYGNDARDNIVGVFLQWSSRNHIMENNFSNSNVSINLEWSSNNNTIENNVASNNSYYGISLLWESKDNQITNNVANTSMKGLYFDDYSTDNTVNQNVFCDNYLYDIDDDDSNTGDDNTCDLTDNWNDLGTTGCTFVCSKIPKPDLIVTDVKVNWPDNCSICYTIANVGNGYASGGHKTTLHVDGFEVANETVITTLNPKDTYTSCFDFTWIYSQPADAIEVCADSDKVISEIKESNNCLITNLKCGDVNCDGNIDISDVIRSLYYVGYPGQYNLQCTCSVTPT